MTQPELFRERTSNARRGDWLVTDDLTGETIWASEAVRQWNGLVVAYWNAEPRQAQDVVRARPDHQVAHDPRPEPDDVFLSTNEVTADSL